MPELPEVEHLRRSLEPLLVGQRVVNATLRRRDIFTRLDPTMCVQDAMLVGGSIVALHRHGKNLSIEVCDGRVLGVHLGMSGQCFVTTAQSKKALTHCHAEWQLASTRKKNSAQRLVFRDPRRFGGLTAAPNQSVLESLRWSRLGPDALNITLGSLKAQLTKTHRSLKAALLDQSVFAGLGNIYVDEALFAARLHPLRAADSLTSDEFKALHSAIRRVLRQAVNAGGSTIRDYRDGAGQTGSYATKHLVYGRGGQRCANCDTPLSTDTIAQRTTVWCAQCQPR